MIRSSRLQMMFKIAILKNLSNFKWRLLCWNLYLINLYTSVFLKPFLEILQIMQENYSVVVSFQ